MCGLFSSFLNYPDLFGSFTFLFLLGIFYMVVRMSQKMAAHRDVKFWEWGRMWVVLHFSSLVVLAFGPPFPGFLLLVYRMVEPSDVPLLCSLIYSIWGSP